MFLKNKIIYIIFILNVFIISFAFSNDIIKKADELDHNGKYEEALKLLIDNNNSSNPDLKIIWRIGRETFEIANNYSVKEKKIKFYDIGINATKTFIDINFGENWDRAEIIHWYAVNYASKMKVLGIFAGRESMSVLPTVFKLIDKCIEIDPTYAPGYFFKGKLQEEVPFFLGGDKFEMEINYNKVLKYTGENEQFFFLVDIARSFYNRNWSVKKKKSVSNKKSLDAEETISDLSDREYAYQLLLKAKEKYGNNKKPSKREVDKNKELEKFLKEIKN